MNRRLLIAQKGIPDKRGEVWDTDRIGRMIGDLDPDQRVLTINFDPAQPVGKFLGIYETPEALYADVWIDETLAAQFDSDPEGYVTVAPALLGDKVFSLSVLSAPMALWVPNEHDDEERGRTS